MRIRKNLTQGINHKKYLHMNNDLIDLSSITE